MEFGISKSLRTENHIKMPQMHFDWRQTYFSIQIWGNHRLGKGRSLITVSYLAGVCKQGTQYQTSLSEEKECEKFLQVFPSSLPKTVNIK